MYETIPLKVFFHICETGNLAAVQVKGDNDEAGQSEAWEEIVKKDSEAKDNNGYSNYADDYATYNDLLNEFQKVKSMLIRLSLKYDKAYVDYLNIKGYRIYNTRTENREEDTKKYTESLLRASNQSDNLKTKIKMKENELVKYAARAPKARATFDAVIADMMFDLKMNLNDDITLARYNELAKRIKLERSRKSEKHERRN